MLENQSMDGVSFELGSRVRADFADILSVKQHDFALGDPRAREAACPIRRRLASRPSTTSSCSRTPRTRCGRRSSSRARSRGRLQRDVSRRARAARALGRADRRRPRVGRRSGSCRTTVERRFGEERGRVRDSLAAWQLRVPQLRAEWVELEQLVRPVRERSRGAADAQLEGVQRREAAGRRHAVVHDRVRARHAHHVPADAAVRARSSRATRSPRSRRCRRPRTTRRSTRSRGRSSTRCGRARRRRTGSAATTGRVDATPLYLILLSEVWRWTDDVTVAQEFKEPALQGARVDRPVRRPRRRRVRRVREACGARSGRPVVEGLLRLAALPRRAHRDRRRSRRARCRATSTTRSGGWPRWRATRGATVRSPSASTARPTS